MGTLRLSWRRLGVLLRQLPLESATATAQAGGPQWGPTEYLLRALIAGMTGHVYPSPGEAQAERSAIHARTLRLQAFAEERRQARESASGGE
ncbi:MAG TPA: hypothetical protein VFN21_11720 [Acidimicrobiales bacterium]|nr:hypothetical protein [Acidimicrobiales bacterium]